MARDRQSTTDDSFYRLANATWESDDVQVCERIFAIGSFLATRKLVSVNFCQVSENREVSLALRGIRLQRHVTVDNFHTLL